MPTIGVSTSNNAYQQPPAVPVPTHSPPPPPPHDLTAAKPIIKRPVPAISNRKSIEKYPREDREHENLGQNIDVQW